MSRFIFFFLAFCFLLFSCRKKNISLSVSPEDIIECNIQEIDFVYFNSKAKVSYKDTGDEKNFTLNIRIKKDSVIWASATPGLGIEAARIFINKDSIFILDRINNNFYAYDFAALNKMLRSNLDFKILQSLIMGNLMVGRTEKDKLSKAADPLFYLLKQQSNNFAVENFIKISSLKIEKVKAKDLASPNFLEIDYSDFEPLGEYIFPYNTMINIGYMEKEMKKTTLVIHHNKAEISDKELSFPFNIPQKYERK
jgi:hypothetical protein